MKESFVNYLKEMSTPEAGFSTENTMHEFLLQAIYGFADENRLNKKFMNNNICWWSDEEVRLCRKKLKNQQKVCKKDKFSNSLK